MPVTGVIIHGIHAFHTESCGQTSADLEIFVVRGFNSPQEFHERFVQSVACTSPDQGHPQPLDKGRGARSRDLAGPESGRSVVVGEHAE
jgi:hypothetical protein